MLNAQEIKLSYAKSYFLTFRSHSIVHCEAAPPRVFFKCIILSTCLYGVFVQEYESWCASYMYRTLTDELSRLAFNSMLAGE